MGANLEQIHVDIEWACQPTATLSKSVSCMNMQVLLHGLVPLRRLDWELEDIHWIFSLVVPRTLGFP